MHFRNLPHELMPIPKDPKWIHEVDEIIRKLKGKYPMRTAFTTFWNSLTSQWKSALISLGAIILATSVFIASKSVFPGFDWQPAELIITTAIMGWIANLFKEIILTT